MEGHGDAPTAVLPTRTDIEMALREDVPDTIRILEMAERLLQEVIPPEDRIRLLYVCAWAHTRLGGYTIFAANKETGKHDLVIREFSLELALKYLEDAYSTAVSIGDPRAITLGCHVAATIVKASEFEATEAAIAQAKGMLEEVSAKLICDQENAVAETAMADARARIMRVARQRGLPDPFACEQ